MWQGLNGHRTRGSGMIEVSRQARWSDRVSLWNLSQRRRPHWHIFKWVSNVRIEVQKALFEGVGECIPPFLIMVQQGRMVLCDVLFKMFIAPWNLQKISLERSGEVSWQGAGIVQIL